MKNPKGKICIVTGTPTQRMCDSSGIASVVAFLATEDFSRVSGQTLFASGTGICS